MIEELTPGILATSMVLILLCAPVITTVLSAFFLWRYHRAVVRFMSSLAEGGSVARREPPVEGATAATGQGNGGRHPDHYRLASRGPLRDALACALAIMVAAVPLSLAAQVVYPTGLGLAGFAIGVWIYSWPAVPACALVLPRSLGILAVLVLAWVLVYALLSTWAVSYHNVASQSLGGITIPARSGVTPGRMALLWLSVNGVPTVLCLLCFNPLVRAVAPLVLALVTLVSSGIWGGWMWMSTPGGLEVLEALVLATGLQPAWVLLSLALALLLALIAAGWGLVRWIARAYRHKDVSDRSLALDAVYLAFVAMYGLWLVMGGLAWIACIPLAFALYKLAVAGLARLRPQPPASRGLCFLRVFALGRRSEGLREAIGRYWRHIGSIQLITGPDVATGTVQPHQFLDFLSGKLDRHFISDDASLTMAVAALDRQPDPDGRFRINGLFCYEDTWQSVLPALVGPGDALMMDLRGFNVDNAGCRDELLYLAGSVPAAQCLLLVDVHTDRQFLRQTLAQGLAAAPGQSPNAGVDARAFGELEFTPGDRTVRRLLRLLCESGAVAAGAGGYPSGPAPDSNSSRKNGV